MRLDRAAVLAVTVGLSVGVFGCGNSSGSGGLSSLGSGGSAGSGDTSCTAPTCGGCLDCFSQCFCQTSNMQGCINACKTGAGGTGGGTGSGGVSTGGVGTGGTTGGVGTGGVSTGGTGGVSTGGVGGGTGGVSTGGTGGGTGGVGGGTGGTGGSAQQQIIQFDMTPFTIQPGSETFNCQNFANPMVNQDLIFNESESFMSPGSHHLFLFEDPNVTANGPLEYENQTTCNGLTFQTLVHSAQTPQETTTYPPGVAGIVHSGSGFRMLVHYLNTTTSPIQAQVSVLLYVADPSTVQAYAAAFFTNTISGKTIAPYSQATWSGSFRMPYDVNLLFGANHMHSHATHFIATDSQINNAGTQWCSSGAPSSCVFETTQWSEPPPAVWNPALRLPSGSTFNWSCDYNNTTSSSLSFCESAATCEMCIFSGRYYPAPNGNPLNCVTGGC